MKVALNKASVEMKNKVKNMRMFNTCFKNYEITQEEFYETVAVEGYPFCIARLEEDEYGYCHRVKVGFKSCDVIAVDIDNTCKDNYRSYEEAVADPFVVKNALCAYTTPSHTKEHNRYRIVFQLPDTVTDKDELKVMIDALIAKFKGDTQASCYAQSFFGCTNSTSKFFGNIFDRNDLEEMVAEYKFEESKERKEIESSDLKNIKLTLDDIVEILDYIFKDGKIDNYFWFVVITVLSAYCKLSPDVIKELLSKYFKDLGDIDLKIKHAENQLKSKTIASLIYIAKQNGYIVPKHLDLQRKDIKFWDIIEQGSEKNPYYKCEYVYPRCLNFIKNSDFHIYCGDGIRQLVRIENNIISKVSESYLHEYLRSFVDTSEKDFNEKALDKFDRTAKIMIPAVLASLPDDTTIIDEKIIHDTKNTSYMFFKNGYLEISNEINLFDYSQLDGFIWESSQKDHNIDISDETVGEYEGFINKVASTRDGEMVILNKEKFNTLKSSTGYLLHNFKDPSFAKCVVLTDEVISNSPQGGTGKSLYQKSLSKVINTVVINGTDFQNNKNYTYEKVEMDTRLINIDDCMKKFDFTELFSVTTADLSVRRRYVSQMIIPYETSPKFCISSNTVINGDGSSFRRRMIEIEFSNYFSDSYTPVNEYGHNFFSDWDSSEWNRFYFFMANCVLYYLTNGVVEYERVNIAEKKTKSAIGESLFEFFDNYIVEDKYFTAKFLLDELTEGYNEEITPTKLTQSLKKYADFKNLYFVYDYDKNLKSKVYIVTNQEANTLSEMKKIVEYEENLNTL